jgi:hypothetical protein
MLSALTLSRTLYALLLLLTTLFHYSAVYAVWRRITVMYRAPCTFSRGVMSKLIMVPVEPSNPSHFSPFYAFGSRSRLS